jgi:hypothetical protein
MMSGDLIKCPVKILVSRGDGQSRWPSGLRRHKLSVTFDEAVPVRNRSLTSGLRSEDFNNTN